MPQVLSHKHHHDMAVSHTKWTLSTKDQFESRQHSSDYFWLFEANIDHTSGLLLNQQPGHRSSCFCNPRCSTLRPSTDTWPHNHSYDLSRASKLIPDPLDSLSPRTIWQSSLHFWHSMDFLPKLRLYTTA